MPNDVWIMIWTRFSTAVDLCAVWQFNSNNCWFIGWGWNRKARAILYNLVSATETLAMTAMDMKRLRTWERKILRKTGGRACNMENTNWSGIREPYKDLDILADIKKKALKWTGHIGRMDQGSIVKKIFESEPDGIGRREDLDWDGWKMLVRIYWWWRWRNGDRRQPLGKKWRL